MRRVSTGLSIVVIAASFACFFLPSGNSTAAADAGAHKPDFYSAGVDMMPVGTAKQVAKLKRARASRKA